MVTYTAKSIKYQVIENHHFDDRQEAQKIAQMQSFEVGVSFLEEDGNLIPRMVYIDGAAFYLEASGDAVSQASNLQADLDAAQVRIAELKAALRQAKASLEEVEPQAKGALVRASLLQALKRATEELGNSGVGVNDGSND